MNAQTAIPAEMLTLYEKAPNELETVLKGLSENDLDKRLSPESWSIRQIVHHMVDGDGIWTLLMKIAIFNSGTSFDFGWYKDNDISAEKLLYTQRSIEPVVSLFQANRAQMSSLFALLHNVKECYIQLTTPDGAHPIPLSRMVVIQATHAMEHIEEIRAILHTSL